MYANPAAQLLTVVDDTRPKVSVMSPLTFSTDLVLQSTEPIEASGFSVTKTFKDYSDRADSDISDRFELIISEGNIIVLRL